MIVGIGGGFDVFTGLPFVYHWPDKQFVLVNNSPSGKFAFRESTQEDHPEGLISDTGNVIAKYSVGKHGAQAFKKAYAHIAKTHNVEAILAVDGGIDSLMRGDEEEAGTILEDFIAMAALSEIDLPKVHCCAGFGAETEENVNHYRVLENMAALAADCNLIGSFSLTQNDAEFTDYFMECEAVWKVARKSHIQTKIISAALGRFGDNNKYKDIDARVTNSTGITFISPLTSIFWMFNFDGVAQNNLAINSLKTSNTFTDAFVIFREFLAKHPKRSKKTLPL